MNDDREASWLLIALAWGGGFALMYAGYKHRLPAPEGIAPVRTSVTEQDKP